MQGYRTALTIAVAASLGTGAHARSAVDSIVAGDTVPGQSSITRNLPAPSGNLECVPYARTTSGIQIYGDAHTWWKQAQGRYARGHVPVVGAVLALRPHGNSTLGHVATVSQVVDSRTILLDHANWSYPGQIETGVTALDVSENNDWSRVRIWYGPTRSLGVSEWPVAGFIYNAKPGSVREPARTQLAAANVPGRSGTRTAQRRNDFIGSIIASAD